MNTTNKKCLMCDNLIKIRIRGNGQIYTNDINRKFCSYKCHDNWMKGKTLEKILGDGNAQKIKQKMSIDRMGEKNSFYGKKHTQETKNQISVKNTGYVMSKKRKVELSEQMSNENNPMFGKSFYDIWVKKYGKEEADKKLNILKNKQKENNSGEKNSMFGKPSPKGSGNGVKGYYKNIYFRSLLELSYLVKIIDRFGLKWESGEKRKYKISYIDYFGKIRNYFSDYIIEDKYMVEMKPRKLHDTPMNKLKRIAAEKWCQKNGYIYKLRDMKKLSQIEVNSLYKNGEIIFEPRYEKLFKEKYEI